MNNETFELKNLTRSTLPSVPFGRIKEKAMGRDYELSVVFIGDTRSRALNLAHRGKDKPTNILSFPLSKTEGEIFIDLHLAKKEAPKFGRSYTNYIAFLFIHGLIHLKGFDHGSTMERKEQELRTAFSI